MKKLISVLLVISMIFSLGATALAVELPVETPHDNSQYFETGEYFLHYRTFEPEGKVKNQLMLFHGFCLSTFSLEAIAAEYQSEGYRVVIVDVPNFGYSVRETEVTALRAREEVIYDLMVELGGPWIVGGHSMGGGIAINLACDYPEYVTGLILFAPQTAMAVEGKMAELCASKLAQTMYEVILKLALKVPFVVKLLVAMSFSDTEYAKSYDLSRITAPLSVKNTGAGMAIMASHARGNDFEKLSELDIPCAIITAKNDKVASASNLEEIIANAPEGTVTYEFEDGGHMMMEYHPAEVAEKTLPVIAECKGGDLIYQGW